MTKLSESSKIVPNGNGTTSTADNALIDRLLPAILDAVHEHLENCTNTPDYIPFRGDATEMAYKINRTVNVSGRKCWIHANSEQEYAEKLLKLYSGDIPTASKHNFSDYAMNWFEVYSRPNIETATAATYKRQLTKYLNPHFQNIAVEDITPDDVQRLFNGMNCAKATKDKVRIVLNMILNAAIEDGLLAKNPLKSSRIRITGTASKCTQEYTVEQVRFLIQNLNKIKLPSDRAYMVLQALHPLCLEEVLGLKWEDVDFEHMTIHIRRAVTHPTRNQPEIKAPKTVSSVRVVVLSHIAAEHLTPGPAGDFVFGGASPLSYTQVRRMCDRIQRETGFSDKITPIRFRTTALTDLYENTKDIKAVQAAAGHTTAAMTLKHYVKGRESVSATAGILDRVYSA